VDQARQQEARVEERPLARREVVAIPDQPVVRRLAYPGEVLELVGRVEPVGARQRAAAGQ
jgi:hypothetical protein